jgi:molybdate transport system substrate-binding protein
VFAAADERTMASVAGAGLADEPQLFASNTLVIAVPVGNPGGVKTIEDLGWPETTVVLCAPEVPCGAASETLLTDNGVTVTAASLEQNVIAVLTKVAAGEADAGLVYATDAAANDEVRAVAAAGAESVVNRYPIAPLREASNPPAAAAFVAFVLSDEGQAVLSRFGFGAA